MIEAARVLQLLYETKQNFVIETFFDRGIVVKLGDELNGFTEERGFLDFEEAILWLCEKTKVTC